MIFTDIHELIISSWFINIFALSLLPYSPQITLIEQLLINDSFATK